MIPTILHSEKGKNMNKAKKKKLVIAQWHPTPVLLPGEPHGQRSLVGYSPWDHKESDTAEHVGDLNVT